MLELNPGCTSVNFKNIKKTKENIELIMYGVIEPELIDKEIEKYETYIDNDIGDITMYKEKLDELIKIKSDKLYKEGLYPRGIEKIILQTMEIFSFWHSLSTIDKEYLLNSRSYLSNLFTVSVTFMISCEVAKLFNKEPDDFSLCNLWKHHENELLNSSFTDNNEIEYITEQFKRNEKTRNQAIKRFIDFRNKTIAHNSRDIGLNWSDFLETIYFILRVWGILDEFISPNCFPRPIQLDNSLYQPLYTLLKADDVQLMKNKRLEIMKQFFSAASKNIITGNTDNIKPFGNLIVNAKITTNSDN